MIASASRISRSHAPSVCLALREGETPFNLPLRQIVMDSILIPPTMGVRREKTGIDITPWKLGL